jgi:hypothetical protein
MVGLHAADTIMTNEGLRVEGPANPTSQSARHLFRAYGLLFASSIPVPEMTPVDADAVGDQQPDVNISLGTMPEHLEQALIYPSGHEANAEQFLLRVADVGEYLVSRGVDIVIDPAPGVTAHELRVFMLGTCLGVLLHQRGFLVLHASGIGTEQGAVLFAGNSGAGKSTLLAELLRRGEKMLVDDVCAIRVRDDALPIVVPSYPRTRLWGETAARLSIDTTDLTRTRPQMDKYERQVPEQFWDREVPLFRLYHLAGSNGSELSLMRLGPLEAFNTVLHNTYRKVLLEGLVRQREHFEMVSRTARASTVIRVIRPVETFQLRELADLVMLDLQEG